MYCHEAVKLKNIYNKNNQNKTITKNYILIKILNNT